MSLPVDDQSDDQREEEESSHGAESYLQRKLYKSNEIKQSVERNSYRQLDSVHNF